MVSVIYAKNILKGENMKQVKYSILVPVYNKLRYLKKYFRFIANQEYLNYEIIVVDDNSNDGSYEYLSNLEKEYSNLYVYKNSENVGLGENRNILLSKAKGEYVLFVDPDDYVEIDLLKQIDFVNNNLDVIRYQNVIEPVTRNQKSKEAGKDKYRYSVKGTEIISGEEALLLWFLGERKINTFPWTYVYKKELFDNIHYPKTMILEDFAITPFLIAKAKKVKAINYIGYHYLLYDDSLSKKDNDLEKVKAKLTLLKEMILLSEKLMDTIDLSDKTKKIYIDDIWNRYYIRKEKINKMIESKEK